MEAMSFSVFLWLLSAPTWVSNSQRFMMLFNDASKLFPAPVGRATPNVFWTSLDDSSPLIESPLPWAWYIARKSGSKRGHVFSGFFYSPLLQMIRGTSTPCCRVSIFSGSFAGGGAAVFLALGQGSFHGTTPYFQELLFWLLQLLEFVKVVNPAERCCALLEDLLSFSYVVELLLGLRDFAGTDVMSLTPITSSRKGTWSEQMIDLWICCSEHDVLMCFSEHGRTLLMSWRLWPEPGGHMY
ncbi:LOW QUALITY PROTEIN: hypothetical protein HID58_042945 [Brassica napus]|uniref:Secreted protein n=1 Tax=Brassica napus TaxID=3708 RepID=A0ABQ8BG78_BRANA|nr:LOW QUALITY PROTEIN: hypothetical protein HID58_042945 [Brassica napus]